MSRKSLIISLAVAGFLGLMALAPVSLPSGSGLSPQVAVVLAEDGTTPSKIDVTGPLGKFGETSGMGKKEEASAQNKLIETIAKLIQAALGLLGIILVVLVIYAGFLWMTAQGNEEQVSKAKKMLTNAVIGMVIIMAAYAITGFVVNAILTGTGVAQNPGGTPP